MGEFDTFDEKSEFNYVVEFLRALRALLNTCDDASSSLDMNRWYHALNAIRRELSDDMNPEILTQANFIKNRTGELIKEYIEAQRRRVTNQVTQQLYDSLDGYEMFLRKIINKKGYKGRTQTPAGAALRG